MTRMMPRLSIAVAIGLAGLLALTGCKKEENNQTTAKPSENGKVAMVAFNSVCPISGDPVSADVETVQFQGKTIGFCCSDCLNKWKNEMSDAERQSKFDDLKKKMEGAMDEAGDKVKEGMENMPGGGG